MDGISLMMDIIFLLLIIALIKAEFIVTLKILETLVIKAMD